MLRRLALLPAAALIAFVGCGDDTEDPTGSGGSGGDATSTTTSSGGMATTTTGGGMGGDPGDTTPPTVTITDDVMDMTATGPVTFTFTFSEDIGSSFAEADVTVTGGTQSDFTVVDATTATIVVNADPGTTGTMEVTVAAGAFEDLAGNTNTDTATASQAYDIPPLTTVLFDMEGTPPGLEPFGNLGATVVADPMNANNMVAQLDKPTSAPLWGGTTFHYCANFGISVLPFAMGTTTITARVWSPDANVPIRLKVEDSTDPGLSVETEAMVTAANTWETLTFDLSMEVMNTAAINFGTTYDKLSIFPNFGTDGATAGAKTYYIDDVTFVGADFTTDCPAIPIDLRPDGGDAWIGFNGGTPAILDQAAGGAQIGQAAAGAAYVIPFVLPAIPAGGFTEANLQIFVDNVSGDGALVNLHGDLYGLPYRTAADVTMNGVLQTTMFHAAMAVDANATLLVDDFLTSATAGQANLDTDMAGDAALVAYLNAQVANGAVAGDFIYLRISPDAPPPIGGGYNWVVGAAVDANAPPNRPTLTIK